MQSIEEASKGFSRSASGNHLVSMAGAAGAGGGEEEVETYDDEEELELEEENLYQELNEEEQRPVVAPPRDKVGNHFKNQSPKIIFTLFFPGFLSRSVRGGTSWPTTTAPATTLRWRRERRGEAIGETTTTKKKRRSRSEDSQSPSIPRQFRTGNWKILICPCRSRVFFLLN